MKGNITYKLDTTKLDKLRANYPAKIEKAVEVTAFNIEAGAKMRAPVLTGFLCNGIHVIIIGPFEARVADAVYYGIINELGIGQPAQPFMGPAAEENVDLFKRMIGEALRAS